MTSLLEVKKLTKRFGGLNAVCDSTFCVNRGEIFGIIGPNGAGKTTLFNLIAGHFRPTRGSVVFEGKDITGQPSHKIGRKGIARTFQAVHAFQEATVYENLRRASILSRYHSPIAFLTGQGGGGSAEDILKVAEFIGLSEYLHDVAGGLAYGLQKILGIGMALMVSPKLLLMDEPAAGLNSSEKKQAGALIRRLRDERGISILVVEHDMPLVLGVCDRILVVNQGSPIALGTPKEVQADEKVIEAYLGEDYEFA